MKTSRSLFYAFIPTLIFIFCFQTSEGQFLKRLKNEVKSRAENKIINKAGNVTDKAIDNTADAATGKK